MIAERARPLGWRSPRLAGSLELYGSPWSESIEAGLHGIGAKLDILRVKLTGLHGIEDDHPTIVLLDAVAEDARRLAKADA